MILLHGYYGERNAGDDAFTTVCVERLIARHGPVRVMASELPRSVAAGATTLLLQRRWWGLAERVEQSRIDSTLARGARVILGGGSLLRDAAGIAEVRRLLDRSTRRGHAALGISIGPWRDQHAERACAELLPHFDFVGVRDVPSLERAQALAPDARVELTFDLAPLLLDPHAVAREAGVLGVALCGPLIDEIQFERLVHLLSEWLAGAGSRRLVLLPFNVHPRKGDTRLHRRLAERLDAPERVSVEPYSGDPRAMWRRIAQLEGLVAMRLHAGIFGYCSGTPTLLVPYEEKCHAWADMIGHPPELICPLPDLTDESIPRLGAGVPAPTLAVESARASALRNFEALEA